jgi:NAD dependent epimerase/dehydratase family enzyme
VQSNLYLISAKSDFPEKINAVSPEILRQRDFSKILAKSLHRPHIFFIPKFVLKILYGEFADEMMISQKVVSKYKIEQEFKNIESTLKSIL